MLPNRSVPVDTILPHVTYTDLPGAIEWLTSAFGFIEHYRYGDPVQGAQLHLGKAFIMVNSARPGQSSPAGLGGATQSLTIFVEDVESHYAHANQAGAGSSKLCMRRNMVNCNTERKTSKATTGCSRGTRAMSAPKRGARPSLRRSNTHPRLKFRPCGLVQPQGRALKPSCLAQSQAVVPGPQPERGQSRVATREQQEQPKWRAGLCQTCGYR